MEYRSFVLAGSCALFVLPLAFYLLRKRKLSHYTEVSEQILFKKDGTKTNPLASFRKDNLTIEGAVILRHIITSCDKQYRANAIMLLHQASAFSNNFKAIRISGCLDAMLDALRGSKNTPASEQEVIYILQTTTNLACDQECLSAIEKYLDTIFLFTNAQHYSDQSCSALQLLCNIALTPAGCFILCDKINALYHILEFSDVYLLRQILSVLLNMSCDRIAAVALLKSKVSNGLLDTMSRCLSSSMQPLVILQAVLFMKHLFTTIISCSVADLKSLGKEENESMYNLLSRMLPTLRIRLALTRSQVSPSDVTSELMKRIDELVQILDDVHFD